MVTFTRQRVVIEVHFITTASLASMHCESVTTVYKDGRRQNSPPSDVRCTTETQTFKTLLKSYLFRQAFNVIWNF